MLKKEITKQELQQLSTFLAAKHKDATPLNLTQTHGFLCAIVSAPSLIMPSRYQHVLLGGYPEFESMQQVQTITNLLMLLHNSIISEFEDGSFAPLLWENNEIINYSDASMALIKQWCNGYMLGAKLDPVWTSNEEGIAYLIPFDVLAGTKSVIGELNSEHIVITDDSSHKQLYKEKLPKYIKTLHELWKEHRKNPVPIYGKKPPEAESVVRKESKVGRNDSCPCGSGHKFKKCCGSANRIIH